MDKRTIYTTLAPRIFNKPLLINPSYMTVLARSMEMQLTGDVVSKKTAFEMAQDLGPQLEVINNAAVIRVYDFLSYRADMWSWLLGGTSYEDIRTQFQAALSDPTVKSIVLDINSPGGEAAGLFDLVDEIYQARGQKPIYAIFNEDGFSAAFAIASAADKRYISRTGSAGSVGVVAMHLDQSGWDAQMGLVYTPIFAGAHKVDYSSHAPLSPEAMASLQEDINTAYDIFVNTVARNLGVSPADVKATEASIYQGKKAVDIKFADSVMSWNQFMTKLTNRKNGGIMKAELEKLFNEMRDKFLSMVGAEPTVARQEVVTKADTEALVAKAEELARRDGHAAGRAEGLEAGRKEVHERVTEIMDLCALAGTEKEAFGYIREVSLSVDDVRSKVVEAQAGAAERTRIRSTVSATSTGAVNVLLGNILHRVEVAKKRTSAAKA